MGKAKKINKEKKYNRPHRSLIAGILILAAAALFFLVSRYTVKTVIVEGNIHYTNEEIIEQVIESRLDQNSLFLSLKYRDKDIEGIPFVEKMSVSILSKDTVKINVYEKSLAGYVEYLGKYMYFDKDGIVVETSDQITEGIPEITGLEFRYVVLHEKLPIEDETIFQTILDITQLLAKYETYTRRIYFDKNREITLYFDNIRVRLGDMSNIDEKVVKMKAILPQLEGEAGVLRMESYADGTKNITFDRDE